MKFHLLGMKTLPFKAIAQRFLLGSQSGLPVAAPATDIQQRMFAGDKLFRYCSSRTMAIMYVCRFCDIVNVPPRRIGQWNTDSAVSFPQQLACNALSMCHDKDIENVAPSALLKAALRPDMDERLDGDPGWKFQGCCFTQQCGECTLFHSSKQSLF